ncbi:glycoside hydrolase family 28 protein [Echinicola strongylocentroti]|uniref:Glycoside hydrolase family 28 protein n=1 Tax=Echinicola strongylocentroti TaxID=1795355 RepID=A0A2Z4IG26_9BACT|nr:glycoside hydrolase family 28 protein [Echinicola strongylocentroti]AWW29556.1 glycoside hydrolase family 28 protein [Echinicola strongylocentroti]
MKAVLSIYCSFFLCLAAYATDYDVRDHGAIGDGKQLDTKSVQAAIDSCHENGGGRVVIPSGYTVLVGTIFLKSHVTLYIERGAVLLGSPDIADYSEDTHKNMYKNEPHMDRCLIFAKDAENFGIEGNGTIDGNGHPRHFNRKTGRPMLIRFLRCNDITMRAVTLQHPAAWTSAWLYCKNIVVEGITITSRVNHNGDGLDFDGCQNVRVSNSSFDTSDDSICLQASLPDVPCRDITVTNCVFTSKWAGMRIGLLSRGDFESVTVSNCTFRNIQDAGLKIQMNEGGTMKNMVFNNLVMKNVPRPVFMTFAQQKACVDALEEMYPMEAMKGFSFDHLTIDNAEMDKNTCFFITGMPGHPIEDISFSNIHFVHPGGGNEEDANRVDLPEYTLEVLDGWWPEFRLVGTLPASAFYLRHVTGLRLAGINLQVKSPEQRPAVVLEDVRHYQLDGVYQNYDLVNTDKGLEIR